MAHEYFLRFSNTTVEDAWKYADEMEKQAEQRIKQKAIEDAKESRDIMERLTKDREKPEVDWTQSPNWANYYASIEKRCFWLTHDIQIIKGIESLAEYQPPIGFTWQEAPSFGLTGNHVVERPQ